MDVMANSPERRPALNQDGFISPLKGATNEPAVGIESANPGALQPFHTLAEVRLAKFDRQMKVIAHDHVGMDPPAEAHRRLAERSFKGLRGPGASKKVATVVTAIDHVITRTCELDSPWSGHAKRPNQPTLIDYFDFVSFPYPTGGVKNGSGRFFPEQPEPRGKAGPNSRGQGRGAAVGGRASPRTIEDSLLKSCAGAHRHGGLWLRRTGRCECPASLQSVPVPRSRRDLDPGHAGLGDLLLKLVRGFGQFGD